MSEPVLSYATVSTVMRPPRAVILFRGDGHWRAWARLALQTAGATWAGGGHLLVPYDEQGGVAPSLIAAAKAFDPDHVLALTPTLAEREGIAPGELPFVIDGEPATPEKRLAVLASSGDFVQPDWAGGVARDLVAAACTPFVTEFEDSDGGSAQELHESTGTDGSWTGPRARDLVGAELPYVAVKRQWISDAALLAASILGIGPESEGPEPDARRLLDYAFSDQPGTPPAELVSQDRQPASSAPSWFQALDLGVTVLVRGFNRSAGAVVLGDDAADFALAAAAHRMQGFGMWVSSEMARDRELMRSTIVPLIRSRLRRAQHHASRIVFTSASLAGPALDERYRQLRDELSLWLLDKADKLLPASTGEPDWTAGGLAFRAVAHDVGRATTVPVLVDSDGTRTMAAEFTLPIPRDERLHAGVHWYVDVEFDHSTMPTGRGIRPSALRAGSSPESTHVRSSREGLSVVAQSFGFIAAGSVLSGQMARPVLRDLGMYAWIKSMALSVGLDAQYSTPGQHAQLVSQRLGSRGALVDMVSGPLRPLLEQYAGSQNEPSQPRDDRPAGHAFLIGGLPYLTITDMKAVLPDVEPGEVRNAIDHLCRRHLARRGLILGCVDCGRRSFIGIDDLAQSYRCPRCAATNVLDSGRWHSGVDEPRWYYDLHNSFRELLATGGDVPLLASAHLRRKTRRYADCAEVVFLENGEPRAEADLVAHADGKVLLVEAKRSNALGKSRAERVAQAAKLARVAVALHADEVILATTKPTWPEADLDRIRSALGGLTDGRATAEVRSLTGLGNPGPQPA